MSDDDKRRILRLPDSVPAPPQRNTNAPLSLSMPLVSSVSRKIEQAHQEPMGNWPTGSNQSLREDIANSIEQNERSTEKATVAENEGGFAAPMHIRDRRL